MVLTQLVLLKHYVHTSSLTVWSPSYHKLLSRPLALQKTKTWFCFRPPAPVWTSLKITRLEVWHLQRPSERSRWIQERCYEFSVRDRKSTRLNSSHVAISYAVFCLQKKKSQQSDRVRSSECA